MQLNKINILYTLSNLLYKYSATKLFCVGSFNGGLKVLNFIIFLCSKSQLPYFKLFNELCKIYFTFVKLFFKMINFTKVLTIRNTYFI